MANLKPLNDPLTRNLINQHLAAVEQLDAAQTRIDALTLEAEILRAACDLLWTSLNGRPITSH